MYILILINFIMLTFPLEAWWWFKKSTEMPLEQKEEHRPTFKIMLYPADGHNHREIENTSERTIAYHFVEELKNDIEALFPLVKVIIPFKEGELGDYLRTASYANRLVVNLYVTINFFPQKEKINKVYLYHVLYNPATDFWQTKEESLAFVPYVKAYKTSIKKTHEYGQKIEKALKKNQRENQLAVQPLIGLPFKPHLGIQVPAVGIEMGLRKSSDYKHLIKPLLFALEEIITQNEPEKKSHESSSQTPALLTDIN